MSYRLVYDVLNDGPPWFGAAIATVVILLSVASFLEVRERMRGRRASAAPGHRGSITVLHFGVVIGLSLTLGGLGVFFAWYTGEAFVQRQLCRKWAQTADYQITEGTVTDYQYRKAGPSFRVAGWSYDLINATAGFGGRFNVPGAPEGDLRDGMRVRLSQHAGFILRVEIAGE